MMIWPFSQHERTERRTTPDGPNMRMPPRCHLAQLDQVAPPSARGPERRRRLVAEWSKWVEAKVATVAHHGRIVSDAPRKLALTSERRATMRATAAVLGKARGEVPRRPFADAKLERAFAFGFEGGRKRAGRRNSLLASGSSRSHRAPARRTEESSDYFLLYQKEGYTPITFTDSRPSPSK